MSRQKTKKSDLTPEEKLAQALVPVEEQPYPVPGNWRWVKLSSVAQWGSGGTPSRKNPSYYGGSIPWIKTGELNDDFVYQTEETITEDALNHSSAKLFPVNTVAIAMYGATIGKVGILGIEASTNQACACGVCRPLLNYKYLFYYARSQKERFIAKAKGGAQPNISQDIIKNHPIPVAPLPEQHRIVARIESLFAKLDEAKEKAQAVVDGFEERKAAILHKAFTGELTKGWREEGKSKLDEWKYVNWEEFLVRIEAGKNWRALGRPPRNGEFGVVKVSSVTWGEFNENESKTCQSDEQWNEEIQIRAGDFLFSRANTLQLVGNCVIVESVNRKLMLSDKILRFHFDDSVVSRYVLQYTRSIMYRKQVEELASGNQDGMRNISQKNLRQIQFPIAPLGEQNEIVRILDRILDRQQQAKSAAEQVLDQIDTMKKAILARAFRGELGTNDPAEESAVEMVRGR